MRQVKLKRVALVVTVLAAAVLLLHLLLVLLLARSEEAAQQESYSHALAFEASTSTQPTWPSLQLSDAANTKPPSQSPANTKPVTNASTFGTLLRAFLKQCAPGNVSEDLYESYYTNRQFCKEPLLEDLGLGEALFPSLPTVLFTLRTTASYHHKRLPLLFDTWLSGVRSANRKVVVITDARDEVTERTAYDLGIDYVVTHCSPGHNRSQLCCKAGVELATALTPPYDEFEWLCHVDDDMYVLVDVLMGWLSKLDPHKDHVYVGRASSPWHSQQRLQVKEGATFGRPGVPFDFALGGLYCLSRAMVASIAPYLCTAKSFADVCSSVDEPDDVTLGIVTGAVLRYPMVRTNLIHTHGQNLAASVHPLMLHKQVAISYGYGVEHWGVPTFNCVCVPNAMFNVTEDPSQFRSLHCFLHPSLPWCIQRQAVWDASPMVRVKRPGLHCLYW